MGLQINKNLRVSPFVKPGATKRQLNDMIHELICTKHAAAVDPLEIDAETNVSDRISAAQVQVK